MSAIAAAILVELFTSEGCSSCPPADAVLAKLQKTQPLPGVQLVVLSEHVDYWDNLGWRDRFSSALFTERQSRYGDRIYTPQAMLDGRIDVLGSDEQGVLRAAKGLALEPHGTIVFARDSRSPRTVQMTIRDLPPHARAQVFLAVVEDGLVSKIERGENQGRTLSHTAVVRALKPVATLSASVNEWRGEAEIPQDSTWKSTRLVAFVQDQQTLRVLASASP